MQAPAGSVLTIVVGIKVTQGRLFQIPERQRDRGVLATLTKGTKARLIPGQWLEPQRTRTRRGGRIGITI